MTLKRMDNVLIVVDDLEAMKAFFIALGLTLEGQTTVDLGERAARRALEAAGVEASEVVAASLQGVLRKDARSFDVLRIVEHHQGL